MRRQIVFSHAFSQDVQELGGYGMIDPALETVEEALVQNPYVFPKFESDFVSFRYAIIKPINDLPALAMQFTIDERGNVVLEKIYRAQMY